MARSTKHSLTDLQRVVLKGLADESPQELEQLAERWWGSSIANAAEALEELAGSGLVHAQHLYPGQLLFQRIDPKSSEGRARGSKSFYKLTTAGKRALQR
jgi:predicted transcriptional regulator